jgi:c-di-AMP phosphodiesterase-like protein
VAFIAEETEIPYNIVVRQDTTLAKALTDRIAREMPGCMITPEEARAQFSEEDLVVIVDTFSKDIVEDAELYNMAKHVVVIDHHRQMVNYLDNTTVKLHDPHASSAAELVTGMIQYFEWRDQMPQFTAEALLSGIMLDTKNFVLKTGVRTFEAAAYLRRKGANTLTVKEMFSGSIETYREKVDIVCRCEITTGCAISTSERTDGDVRLAAAQAADEMLSLTGVAASFVIFPDGERINISARSYGKVNVQVIMEKLGGGGHQTMAATQLYDTTMEQAMEQLKTAIDESLKEEA